MEKNEYQSKFFLTGFLLASGIIMYLTMIFVVLFIGMNITSLLGAIIGILAILVTAVGYFYVLHRFEQQQTYSQMAMWYALTICLLGLLVSSFSYLGALAIIIVNSYGPPVLAIIATSVIGYVIVTEIFAIASLLAASFELRELVYRRFNVVYLITVVTLLLVSYVFKTITYGSITAAIVTVVSCFGCTYYILNRQKQNISDYDIENVENRYRFVVKALINCALVPVQMPIDIKNKILVKK